MNAVFTIYENEICELSSGIHLTKRNIHTTHFGTDIISSLRSKIKKLVSDKIKNNSTLAVFKHWSIGNCPWKLCQVLIQDLGFVKPVQISNGTHAK